MCGQQISVKVSQQSYVALATSRSLLRTRTSKVYVLALSYIRLLVQSTLLHHPLTPSVAFTAPPAPEVALRNLRDVCSSSPSPSCSCLLEQILEYRCCSILLLGLLRFSIITGPPNGNARAYCMYYFRWVELMLPARYSIWSF